MFQGSIRVGAVVAACVTLQLLVAAGSSNAQPTAEQQSALRNNCRSDFMSHCSGVTPGGAQALQCLQRNVAKLSPGCQSAVNALSPRPSPQQTTTAPPPASAAAAPAAPAPAQPAAAMPAPAAAPAAPPAAGAPTPEQQAALRQLCGADYMAKCSHVAPASHQALQCLQSHSADLSANCRGALALFSPGSAPQPAQTAAPAPAPAARPATAPPPAAAAPARPAAAAASARPTAQQQAAIRQSCQGDFMSKCSGVQPGGADALRCLQRNSAQLSPNCRSAVAAIGGGGTATAIAPAAPAAAAAAPAAMPTPEQQAAIKRTCQRDFMMNCRGVQPGGPEAFACLQRNAAKLSPDCRTSLAAVAGGAPATASAAAPAAAQPAAGGFRPVGPLRRAIRERMMSQ